MSYERLIIDRLERKCDVLFSCNYTDKQKGWEMRENKIKITPENVPVTPDKEVKIIADTNSCHGIDAIHNTAIIGDKNRWAYVTIDTDAFFSVISGLIKQLQRRDYELNTICEALEIEYLRHVETGEITCRSYKLIEKERECEELKSQIDADYEDYSQELKTLRNIIENKEKRNARLFVISNNYRKALEEIEQELKEDIYCESQECGCDDFGECLKCTKEHILDIINKTKDGKNEQL